MGSASVDDVGVLHKASDCLGVVDDEIVNVVIVNYICDLLLAGRHNAAYLVQRLRRSATAHNLGGALKRRRLPQLLGCNKIVFALRIGVIIAFRSSLVLSFGVRWDSFGFGLLRVRNDS